jgi:hypothetical protein
VSVDRVLQLKLIGDVSDINKKMGATTSRLSKVGASAKAWGKAFAFSAVIDGIGAVTDALGDAWSGFREGEQAAAQLGVTWKNLGLNGAALQESIDAIGASAKSLWVDDTESIMAFSKALQSTGDQESAMRRLKIAQDLVANGSAPNLNSAMKLIQSAANGSSSTVKKFGLTADTAKGRIKELGDKVKGAAQQKAAMDPLGVLFSDMNEDLEGIVGSLASGDLDGAMASLGQVGADLSKAWGNIYPKIASVLDAITGGGWSDFASGPLQSIVDSLGNLGNTILPPLVDFWGKLVAIVGPMVDDLFPKLAPLIDAVGAAMSGLYTALSNALTFLQPVIDVLSPAVEGSLGAILDTVTGLLNGLAQLLNGDFDAAWDTITSTIQDFVGNVAGIWVDLVQGLVDAVPTLIPQLLDAAGKLGGAIVDGIIGALGGLAAAAGDAMTDMINALLRAWNDVDFAFPAGSFQFWGPGSFGIPNPLGGYVAEVKWPAMSFDWQGSGDLIPDVPLLAKGGIVTAPTLAIIGEAGPEAVVPLNDAGFGGGSVTININGDPAVVKAAVLDALRHHVGANGSLRLNGFSSLTVAR